MDDRRAFASVNARLRAHARRSDDPATPAMLHWATEPSVTPPEAELIEAQVPQPLIKYLAALERKLDLLISLQSGSSLREEYPLSLDVREISGAGMSFKAEEHFNEGDVLEVVLNLSDAPPQRAAATGKVVGSDSGGLCRFEFTTIRETDLEAVVKFVFQEEREQIRRLKWS